MNQDHPEFDSEDLAQNPPETDPLKAEIESLRSEIALVKADALRERADLENQRKRIARDVENARKFANEKLLGELLPVFDSLDAGLTAAGTQPSPLRDGLDMTYKQLLKVAADNGLTLLDPVGQPFNPDQHQAISQARPRVSRQAMWCRCSRRATCSTIACCARPWWSWPSRTEPQRRLNCQAQA